MWVILNHIQYVFIIEKNEKKKKGHNGNLNISQIKVKKVMAFDFPDTNGLADGFRITNPKTGTEYAWRAAAQTKIMK